MFIIDDKTSILKGHTYKLNVKKSTTKFIFITLTFKKITCNNHY